MKPTSKTETSNLPVEVESNHPATVEGEIRMLLNENYHSVTIGVRVSVPTEPNDAAIRAGLDYCYSVCESVLNEQIPNGKKALKAVTKD